jgi:hypothetical protein
MTLYCETTCIAAFLERVAFQHSLLLTVTVYLATLDLLLLTNTPAATIS